MSEKENAFFPLWVRKITTNFLFRYLLVDFGLAQEYDVEKPKSTKKTSEESTEAHGTKRKRTNEVE